MARCVQNRLFPPIAARLARASGGSITLLRVVTHPRDAVAYLLQPPAKADTALEGQHAKAVDYLTHLASSGELADVGTALEVADSGLAQTILSAAHLQQVDSIVMCSHGTTGFKHWALGSVAQKVARHSPVPILLLRAEEDAQKALHHPEAPHALRILVALDGSALAEAALLPAAFLSSALSAPAHGELSLTLVLTGVEGEQESQSEQVKGMKQDAQAYLEGVRQRLGGDCAALHVQVTSSVALGMDVADTLIRLAENGDDRGKGQGCSTCDVIAMTTHGRDGAALWVMGSVTERVLDTTKLPLLIIRPQVADIGSAEDGRRGY